MIKYAMSGLALGLTLMWAGHAESAIRATKEFKAGSTRPLRIALLPVRASAAVARVVKTESRVEESSELGEFYALELGDRLEAKGYLVRSLTADEVNADPLLQEYVLDANRRYDEMLAQLRFGRIKRRIYNLGDEARLLARYLDVDAIAFARLSVVAATGGRTAVAVLIGIGSLGGSQALVGIVDGRSGDLEAVATGSSMASAKSIEENPRGEMGHIAESTLRRFPDADPSARATDGDPDDDAVLEDIEALLQ